MKATPWNNDIEAQKTHIKYRKFCLIGIRIRQEVGFNSLEHAASLLFASLDLIFFDIDFTFGMVLTGGLADGSTIRRCSELDFIRDWFKGAHQSITLNHTVSVCEVLFVYSINPVLYIIELAPFIPANLVSILKCLILLLLKAKNRIWWGQKKLRMLVIFQCLVMQINLL